MVAGDNANSCFNFEGRWLGTLSKILKNLSTHPKFVATIIELRCGVVVGLYENLAAKNGQCNVCNNKWINIYMGKQTTGTLKILIISIIKN